MIRGKKNFLPPVQLVYGFGYLFKLDESSIGNHVSEKRSEEQQQALEKEAKDEARNEAKDEPEAQEKVPELQEKETEDAISDKDDDGMSGQDGSAGSSVKQGDDASESEEDQEEEEEEDESSDSSDDEEAFPDTQLAAPAPPSAAEDKDEKWNKYDLGDYGADNDADELPSFAQPGSAPSQVCLTMGVMGHVLIYVCMFQRKKFITAKERRQMKKGDKGEAPPAQAQKQAAPAKKDKVCKENVGERLARY